MNLLTGQFWLAHNLHAAFRRASKNKAMQKFATAAAV